MKIKLKTGQFFDNLNSDQKFIIKFFVTDQLDVGEFNEDYNFKYIKYDYLMSSLNNEDITSKFMNKLSIPAQRTFGSILSLKDK